MLASAVLVLTAGCVAKSSTSHPASTTSGASNSASSLASSASAADNSAAAAESAAGTASAAAASSVPAVTAPVPGVSVPPPVLNKTVVIDPGHNGANAANAAQINKQVPDGAGGTKACNTTGTATNAGYSEHAFNWDVAVKLKALLVAKGITVIMTRPDDSGVGPCVNERAAIGNQANADAVISIHGDGAAAAAHGFFCMLTSMNPGGGAIKAKSQSLASDVRDAIKASAVMPPANYEGANGIDPSRSDLAGLNLSTVPTTMCELGNMRSATDSVIQTSESGRAALAAGIAKGLLSYLAS